MMPRSIEYDARTGKWRVHVNGRLVFVSTDYHAAMYEFSKSSLQDAAPVCDTDARPQKDKSNT
jgi:hypothetical protein